MITHGGMIIAWRSTVLVGQKYLGRMSPFVVQEAGSVEVDAERSPPGPA
jgi:hypothetical protein